MATTAGRGPGRAQQKGRSSGGRATAKGGPGGTGRPVANVRYTPPVDRSVKVSPRWVGVLMVALFVLGVLVVILNYVNALPGGVNNLWLLVAIGFIFAGLLVATRYR